MKQKPGITLITIYYVLGGLVMLAIAAGIQIIDSTLAMGIGATIGILALIPFAVAYGIYNLEAWGWYAAMILNVLSFFGAIMQPSIMLIIPVAIIYYLWVNQRDFRVRFG